MCYLKKVILLIVATTFLFIGILSLIIPVFPGASIFLLFSIELYRKSSNRIAKIKYLKRLEYKLNKIKEKLFIQFKKILLNIYISTQQCSKIFPLL